MITKHLLLSVAISGSVACGEVADGDDATSDDASTSPTAAARCVATDPATCRYTSDLSFAVGVADGLVLHDPARGDLPVPLLVHYPVGATNARPVVIWNHGGPPSAGGKNRSEEWGQTLAAAGYVVIHPSRVPVTNVAPFQAECTAEGFPLPEECALFVAEVKFGPQTAVFVLDSLAAIEAQVPELAGRLDARRVIIAGHSAGSPVPLTLAGAVRVVPSGQHRGSRRRGVASTCRGTTTRSRSTSRWTSTGAVIAPSSGPTATRSPCSASRFSMRSCGCARRPSPTSRARRTTR
jgi:poly(3-hydroxybutyrate) depolymerase